MSSYLKKISRSAAIFLLSLMAIQAATAQTTNCNYRISNEWNSGYIATITLTNNTARTIDGWSVNWLYNTNRITNLWNATISGTSAYTANALSWNSSISPGGSAEFGFQVDKNGAAAETPVISGATCSSSSSSTSSAAGSCVFYGDTYPICPGSPGGWGSVNGETCIDLNMCGEDDYWNPSSSSSSDSSSSSSSSSYTTSAASSSVSSGPYLQLKNLANFPIGVAVSAGNESNTIFGSSSSASHQRFIIDRHFDQLTAGNIMKMSYLHPSENTYTFEQADALVNYALDNNMTMHGHTLVWHSDYQIPNWMKNYTGDYSTMLQQHVQTIASYYSGRMASWDVVNEAFADDGDSSAVNGYRNSLWYQKMGTAYIEQAFVTARAADPIADLYYNDYNMEGGQEKFTHVLAMVDDFQSRDVPIDGIGFQMHINVEWPSATQIKAAFSEVAARGLKVKITELDIPVNTYSNPDKYSTFTAEAAERQKAKYREVVAAYLEAVPQELRGGITVWGLRDSDSWLIELHGRPDWPLLFNDLLQPKPAVDGFANGLTGAP